MPTCRANVLGALLATSVAVLAGCPVSSTWTTPRTIPQSTMSHTLGLDTFTVIQREGAVPEGAEPKWFQGPGTHVAPFVFPAYVLRMGLGPRLDIGLKASLAGAAQADLKWQLIKTPAFDLALDPTVQLSLVSSVTLPVLFGLNIGESLTITLGPRASFVLVPLAGEHPDNDDVYQGGPAVGGSVGLRIQAAEHLALYPEVCWVRGLGRDANGHLVTAGVGFTIGSGQPEYGPGSIEYVEGGD